jgi:invasion protein IalB
VGAEEDNIMRSNRAFGSLLAAVLIAGPFVIAGSLVSATAQTAPPPPAAKRPQAQAAPKEVQKSAPPVAPAPAVPAPAAAAAPPAAATDNGPSSTTAVYGDWVVRCSQPAGTRVCEAAQTIYVQGQQNPIALIAIGREKQSDPMRLVVQVPLNVTVTTRAKIALKEGDPPLELNFDRCIPSGCFAMVQPADDAVRRLRGQPDAGRITYKDASEQDVGFQFSLRGLAPALEALARS